MSSDPNTGETVFKKPTPLDPFEYKMDQDMNFESVPLLEYDTVTRKHSLNPQGIQVIQDCVDAYVNVAIVSVVGSFRTGKSYLLNRLAHGLCKQSVAVGKQKKSFEDEGHYHKRWIPILQNVAQVAAKSIAPASFTVGHSQNSTTHGINIYRFPIPFRADCPNANNAYGNTCILILDTEGLASPERSNDYDQKIYGLAMALSSIMVFNSGPTMNREGLSLLSMASDIMSKMVIQSPGKNDNTCVLSPSEFVPSLYWIMRDAVALEFCNPSNPEQQWTPTDQLKHSIMLYDQGHPKSTTSLSNIFFAENGSNGAEVKCFPLLKPSGNQKTLLNLELMHDEVLTPDFVKQCNFLVQEIAQHCIKKPKAIEGNVLAADLVIQMLDKFVLDMNKSPSSVPLLIHGWKSNVQTEANDKLWDLCAFWIDETLPLRPVFPSILCYDNPDKLYEMIKYNKPCQVDPEAPKSLVMVDPVLLKNFFDDAIETMQDIFVLNPTSVFVDKAPFTRIFDFARQRTSSILAEAKKRIEQNANTLVASMPIPEFFMDTHYTLESYHKLWTDCLLACTRQSLACKSASYMIDSEFFASGKHIVNTWQDLYPDTISFLWFHEYRRVAIPILSRLHLALPPDLLALEPAVEALVIPDEQKINVHSIKKQEPNNVSKKQIKIAQSSKAQEPLVLRIKWPLKIAL